MSPKLLWLALASLWACTSIAQGQAVPDCGVPDTTVIWIVLELSDETAAASNGREDLVNAVQQPLIEYLRQFNETDGLRMGLVTYYGQAFGVILPENADGPKNVYDILPLLTQARWNPSAVFGPRLDSALNYILNAEDIADANQKYVLVIASNFPADSVEESRTKAQELTDTEGWTILTFAVEGVAGFDAASLSTVATNPDTDAYVANDYAELSQRLVTFYDDQFCNAPPPAPALTSDTAIPNEGDVFAVTCTSAEAGITSYSFSRNSNTVSSQVTDVYSITAAIGVNDGPYTCGYTANGLESLTSDILTIQYRPRRPTLTLDDTDGVVDLGTTATFTCTVLTSGSLTYKFFLNDAEVVSGPSNTYSVTASPNDAGSYTCAASSNSVDSPISNNIALSLTPDTPDAPTLTLDDPNPTEGDTITLTCTSSEPLIRNFIFARNGASFGPQTPGFRTFVAQSTVNDGSYTCAYTDIGSDVSADSNTVTLQYRPRDPTLSLDDLDGVIDPGVTATFTCQVTTSGTPTYILYRNNVEVIRGASNTFSVPASAATEGSYTCLAASGSLNSGFSNAISISLTPIPPAAPTLVLPVAIPTEGQTVNVLCTGAEAGATSFTFTRGGTTVSTQANNGLTFPAQIGVNEGVYSCEYTANGLVSFTSASVTLQVRPRTPTLTLDDADGVVDPGTSARFTCQVVTSGALTYTFYLNGVQVARGSSNTYTVTGTGSTVGSYSCVASSTVDSLTSNNIDLSLTIPQPPAPVLTFDPAKPTEGDVISLSCSSSEPGITTYSFERNSLTVPGQSNSAFTFTGQIGVNDGRYTCDYVAVVLSDTSNTVNIQLRPRTPKLSRTPSDARVDVNETVTFDCSVSSSATNLRYTFFLDGAEIVTGPEDTLVLDNVTSSDEGSYTCLVSSGGIQSLLSTAVSLLVGSEPEPPYAGLCSDMMATPGLVPLVAHPTECDKFIQCYVDYDSGFQLGVVRQCPMGQHWSDGDKKCTRPCYAQCPNDPCQNGIKEYPMEGTCRSFWQCSKGISWPRCCEEYTSFVPGSGCQPDETCHESCGPKECPIRGLCDRRPVWSMPAAYEITVFNTYNFWMPRTCLYNDFNVVSCDCSAPRTTDCLPDQWYDLMDSATLASVLGDNIYGIKTSGVVATPTGASFSTGSYMDVVVLRGSMAFTPLTFKMRFREFDGAPSHGVTLLSSGQNCPTTSSSLLVTIADLYIQAELRFKDRRLPTVVTLPTQGIHRQQAKTFILSYDHSMLTLSVEGMNGLQYVTQVRVPDLLSFHCGLRVGTPAGYQSMGFEGNVGELSVYSCNLNKLS